MGSIILDADLHELQQSNSGNGFTMLSNLDPPTGVPLSSAAVGRFQRLIDRIRLFCLSEIDSCLAEKESLTFLVSIVELTSERLKLT
jgi:hypothetical protein